MVDAVCWCRSAIQGQWRARWKEFLNVRFLFPYRWIGRDSSRRPRSPVATQLSSRICVLALPLTGGAPMRLLHRIPEDGYARGPTPGFFSSLANTDRLAAERLLALA